MSSPSLAGEDLHDGFAREAVYHDTDVFGHEEDHDVRNPAVFKDLFHTGRLSRRGTD